MTPFRSGGRYHDEQTNLFGGTRWCVGASGLWVVSRSFADSVIESDLSSITDKSLS
jgi:hypothetical protein